MTEVRERRDRRGINGENYILVEGHISGIG
jgi:hypothetical protein